MSTVSTASSWADRTERTARTHAATIRESQAVPELVREARMLGGAMIVILLVAVVLNEVFAAVNVGSGPFSQIGTDLETTGVAAIGLLIVGLIIVAANAIMTRFGGM